MGSQNYELIREKGYYCCTCTTTPFVMDILAIRYAKPVLSRGVDVNKRTVTNHFTGNHFEQNQLCFLLLATSWPKL